MSIVKKIAALTGILMLVTSITAEAYSDVAEKSIYSGEIEKIAALGIMNGYPDGTFRADSGISRAEAAVMFSGMLRLPAEDSSSRFYDVPDDYWAKGEIEAAAAFGIVNGTADGAFMPEEDLKSFRRRQFCLMQWGLKTKPHFAAVIRQAIARLHMTRGFFLK